MCLRNFDKSHEIKKHIFPLMITFYNITLKIETSWAKKVVKSILKTWNVNDVIVMFILFSIKKLKICNVKKNNFKSIKFTIQN